MKGKVKMYLGDDIQFFGRNGEERATVKKDDCYVREVNADKYHDEGEILMKELDVDTYIVPEFYKGEIEFF